MHIVDLSLPLYDHMDVYPGDPTVHITTCRTRPNDGYEVRHLSFGSHSGTHVDVPIHMHDNGLTLDDIPLNKFCGPAQVVSLNERPFPSHVGLLFIEAVNNTEVVTAIVDAAPPFVGGPLGEDVERALLAANIITYTDLINVEQLQSKRFTFYGLPLRIRDGDGSPVRAIAVVHDKPDN